MLLVDLTPSTWVVGLSSLVLLLIGYTYTVLFLIKYIYVKKILVPIVALVAFCCGSFYLGPSVSFISLLTGNGNIEPGLYYMLSYSCLPIGTIGIVLMALNVFQPKAQKIAIVIYGILAIIFWIFMFGFTEDQYKMNPTEPNELLDLSHANVSLIITGLSLLSILIIDTAGFFSLSLKLKKRNFPQRDIRKSFMIGLGWSLFVISGVIDALFSPESIGFILSIRFLMLIAFNLIYLGFWSKPTRLDD